MIGFNSQFRFSFISKLTSVLLLISSINLATVTVSDIGAIDSQIKQLSSQSDNGLSEISGSADNPIISAK